MQTRSTITIPHLLGKINRALASAREVDYEFIIIDSGLLTNVSIKDLEAIFRKGQTVQIQPIHSEITEEKI